MENDDTVMIPKRIWQRRKEDRRQKDGTIDDRRNLATALRAGRHQMQLMVDPPVGIMERFLLIMRKMVK